MRFVTILTTHLVAGNNGRSFASKVLAYAHGEANSLKVYPFLHKFSLRGGIG